MADLAGTRLGDYELVERIGSGGMAEVYLAKQMTAFGREVALKVIRTDLSENDEFRARFLREAQAISRLSHPNILPLIEFGEEQDRLYLVMPLIRDGTLRTLLKQQKGPLPLEEGIPLFIQLCNAVQYAHEQGIIHRDIKPQNVLLQQRSHVLLTDFGIARDRSVKQITSVGTGLGTAEYMAPEQAVGRADTRSDIYSLGIVLYQLLTGLLPYQGNTPLELIVKHSNDPPPNPRLLNPALPPQIVAVIETALAKDPDQRFQTASALSRAAQQALVDLISLPRSGSALQPSASGLPLPATSSAQPLLPPGEQRSGYATVERPGTYTTRPASDPPFPAQPGAGGPYTAPTRARTVSDPPFPANSAQLPASSASEQRPADGFPPASGIQTPAAAVFAPTAPPAVPVPQAARRRKLGLIALLVLIVLGVALSAGLVALGLGGKGPFASLGKHPTPTATATPSAPPGFLLYTNLDHSFKLIYPKTWKKSASDSGVGVKFDGPANQTFQVENDGANQSDPAVADTTFCLILSGNPGSPHNVIVAGQRWTQEACDSLSFLGNVHAVIEAISYKGNIYLLSYSSDQTTFGQDDARYFSLMEKSFTFLI